jgi:hypothetical protein
VERIDAEDESFAELAYATGDDDGFIMPHLRRRAELCALHGFWLDKKRRAGNRLPGRHSITNVAREFCRDLTGRSMSELPPEHVGIVTAPFPRVIRHRLPCATRHLAGRRSSGSVSSCLLTDLYRVLLASDGASSPLAASVIFFRDAA